MSAGPDDRVECSACAAPGAVIPGPDRYGPESWCAECRGLLEARAAPAPADASPRCRRCSSLLAGVGSSCDRCRRVLGAVLRAREGAAALPRAEPLVLEVGPTASGDLAFLGVERWDGWFAVRYHLGGDWEARTGGLRGAWHAEDDWGTELEGVDLTRGRGRHGWTSQVAVPGDLHPGATLVCLTLVHQGATLLEVDLPLTPLDGLA